MKNESAFNDTKKRYEKNKVQSEVKEYKSLKGETVVFITDKKETFYTNIKDNVNHYEYLLKKINSNFKLLKGELDVVIKRTAEISEIFKELNSFSEKYYDEKTITESFKQLQKLFVSWSDELQKKNDFINNEIRTYFKYNNLNFEYMKELIENVEIQKLNYKKSLKSLINKKNDLYKKGDFKKWDLSPEDKENFEEILKDKPLIYKKMCSKDTKNTINLKQMYGYHLNRNISEYIRIRHLNSIYHKKNLVQYCKDFSSISTEFYTVLGEIIAVMDSCVNLKPSTDKKNLGDSTEYKKVFGQDEKKNIIKYVEKN